MTVKGRKIGWWTGEGMRVGRQKDDDANPVSRVYVSCVVQRYMRDIFVYVRTCGVKRSSIA